MRVLILLHVVVALSSLVVATLALVRPSSQKLKVVYGLIAGTVLSGTLLVISLPSHLLSVCETGLVYLGIVSVATLAARYRLAKVLK